MRWRVWVAVGFLAAIVVGGILTLRRTERLCEAMSAELNAAYSDGSRFNEAHELWLRNAGYFSALVCHDRIDEVGQCFARAQAFLVAGTMDEYHAELENILLQLALLMEYDRPTIRSLV